MLNGDMNELDEIKIKKTLHQTKHLPQKLQNDCNCVTGIIYQGTLDKIMLKIIIKIHIKFCEEGILTQNCLVFSLDLTRDGIAKTLDLVMACKTMTLVPRL